MTPQQLRALNTLKRLADQLAPRARYAYRSALDRLKLGADLARAERALRTGNIDEAIAALLPDRATAEFTHQLTVAVAEVITTVGPPAAKEIASAVGLRFQFVAGSPAAAAALERMTLASVMPVEREAEAGLRRVLTDGLFAGRNPVAVARSAREFVGLTRYDDSLIRSFGEQLRTDPQAALTRALRDKRFDPTIARAVDGAPLADAQVAVMQDRYVSALHTWRSETWSRTATLKAVRETQHAAWVQAADDLGFDDGRLIKTWITTLDGHERETHHALHGDTQPIDQPYANGDMVPGDGTGVEGEEYNCRCVEVIRLLPADGPRASQFLADRAARFANERDDVAA